MLSVKDFDARDLRSLSDCLAMLPEVKPVKARGLLKRMHDCLTEKKYFEGVEAPSLTMSKSQVRVSYQLIQHLFVKDVWEKDHVTPVGAKLICDLYVGGEFELKKKVSAEPTELMAYANGVDAVMKRKETREKAAKALQNKVANPNTVKESEFTYHLLNQIFFKHDVSANGSMVVGGIKVEKAVNRYSSNSGKTQDWDVSFSWKGSDGQHVRVTKESIYRNNRHNDAERNWGLPE